MVPFNSDVGYDNIYKLFEHEDAQLLNNLSSYIEGATVTRIKNK